MHCPQDDRTLVESRRHKIRAVALGVRFVLELCILVSLADLTAHLPVPILAQLLLGLLFCGTGAAVWGAFLSPKRRYEIGPAARLVLETGFFAGAAIILNHLGWPALAVALILVAVADRIALALIR